MYNSNELKDLTIAVSAIINEATNQYDGDFKVGQKVYVTDGNSGVDFEGTIKAFVGRDQIQVKGTGADRGKTETEHGKFIVSQDDKTFGEATEDKKKKLDKPGEEDADIDNDGDTDASDKYLANRRKVIAKAVKADAKKDKEVKEACLVKLAVPGATNESIGEFISQREGELSESTIFEVVAEFETFMAEAKTNLGAADPKLEAKNKKQIDALVKKVVAINSRRGSDIKANHKLAQEAEKLNYEIRQLRGFSEATITEATVKVGSQVMYQGKHYTVDEVNGNHAFIVDEDGGDKEVKIKDLDLVSEATITEARGEVLKVGDEYYHDEKWRKVTAATNKSVTLDVNGAEVVVQGRVSRRQSLLVRKRADVKL